MGLAIARSGWQMMAQDLQLSKVSRISSFLEAQVAIQIEMIQQDSLSKWLFQGHHLLSSRNAVVFSIAQWGGEQ